MYESFCSICKAACIIPRYSLTEPLLFSPTVVALFSVLFVATQVFCSVSTLEPQEMTGEVDQNIQFYVIFSVFNRAVSTKYNRIWYIILFYNIPMLSWIWIGCNIKYHFYKPFGWKLGNLLYYSERFLGIICSLLQMGPVLMYEDPKISFLCFHCWTWHYVGSYLEYTCNPFARINGAGRKCVLLYIIFFLVCYCK